MSDLEKLELQLPAAVSEFIGKLSRDTGVARDDVASVLVVLAIRQYLAGEPRGTGDVAEQPNTKANPSREAASG